MAKIDKSSVRARRRIPNYIVLERWPALPEPRAVHLDMATHQPGVRIPVRLMRKCGMFPERGVNVAVYQDRVLIRGDECGGAYHQNAESKQMILGVTGISPAVAGGNFAIVEGAGYLVLASREDAMRLAAGVPVMDRPAQQRVDKVDIPTCATSLELGAQEVLAWKDVNVGHSVRDRASRVANVSGHLWWKAGFKTGDLLRFTKYLNGTVVEKCGPAEKHSILNAHTARQIPRHYFGRTLVDLHDVASVRVIAVAGKLIVTRPDSDLATCCTTATYQAAPARPVPAPQVPDPDVPLVVLDTTNIVALSAKNYQVEKGRFTVTGGIWTAAGFSPLQPAKLVHHENALEIVPRAEADMDFRIGTPSQRHPYRNLGLAGTTLEGATRVQVVAAAGRLLITRIGVKFGKAPNVISVSQIPAITEFNTTALHAQRLQPEPHAVPGALAPMKGVLKARRCPVTAGKVVLRGTLMAAAGLSPDDPVRVVRYDDAVVVEACAVVDMDGLVRKENGGRPVVTLTLMGSALENTAHVLALAAKGRVVLAMMADNLEPSAADGTPQPEQPAPEPLANVRRYLVPEGKRLQLQGRWLIQYGFDAGAKYEVHVTGDKVRIELAESGKATVTRYSDTASKLYVPAASLTALAGKEVLVRARKGHLELVTA